MAALRALAVRPDVVLRARVEIDTGLLVIGDLLSGGVGDEETVIGDTPNRAARLQAVAPPDGVVIGPGTRRLLGELFLLEDTGAQSLEGFEEPVPIWRVIGEGRFEARSAQGLVPLVGREHELRLTLDRWQLARTGEGQVLLLGGEGGIGKSRLVEALARAIAQEPPDRLRHFCSRFFAGTALHPVVERIRRRAGLSRDDPPATLLAELEALLAACGEPPERSMALLDTLCSVPVDERWPIPAATPAERKTATLDLLVREIRALSTRLPLLVLFEDVHWIDPTTSELLGLLIDAVRELPVLLVLTFRPEFEPPWKLQTHVTALQLNRFGRRQAVSLISSLTEGRPLPAEVLEVILEKTDGVPLFVEELTRTLLESGALVATADGLALDGPLPLIAIPSTLHASLMARLDRLGPAKEVALRASVLGRSFTVELLAAVSPLARAEVEDGLARLADAGIVFRHGVGRDEVFEFRHALLQEAAYASMLRGRRQQMHARVAETLEASFPETVASRSEIVAHHFAEAGLAEKAIAYHLAASDAAAARYASPEAHARFALAAALAAGLEPTPETRRRELKALLKRASVAAGGTQVAADLEGLARAHELALELGLDHRLAQVHYWTGRLHYVSGRFDEAVREARHCLAMADELGDERIAAVAANLLARIHCLRGEPADGIAHAERNTRQMGRLGNRIEEAAITGVLAFALALSARFTEAQRAGGQAVALADALDHLPTRAACWFFRAVALGWQGRLDPRRARLRPRPRARRRRTRPVPPLRGARLARRGPAADRSARGGARRPRAGAAPRRADRQRLPQGRLRRAPGRGTAAGRSARGSAPHERGGARRGPPGGGPPGPVARLARPGRGARPDRPARPRRGDRARPRGDRDPARAGARLRPRRVAPRPRPAPAAGGRARGGSRAAGGRGGLPRDRHGPRSGGDDGGRLRRPGRAGTVDGARRRQGRPRVARRTDEDYLRDG